MLDTDRFKEKKNRREFHELTRIQKKPSVKILQSVTRKTIQEKLQPIL